MSQHGTPGLRTGAEARKRLNFTRFPRFCSTGNSSIPAGSRIIVRDAQRYVSHSYFIPDAVDHNNYPIKKEYSQKDKYTIGWVGMASELQCLLPVNKTLQRLQKVYGIDIAIILSFACVKAV